MKITAALTDKLLRLAKGESLPASALTGEWFRQMLADGILVFSTKGSRKSMRANDGQSFRQYLASRFDIRDLEAYHELTADRTASRAEQVKMAGDSKVRKHRTFFGFMVNSYEPIPVMLAGKQVELLPEDGTFMFIYDFRKFTLPEDVIIIGVENAENFRYIRQQKWLFDSYFPEDSRLLFVSRYPQEQSHDLMEWLRSIPNRYVHFGDLDLAGIHIYLTEYYRHLGQRASFLISADYEERIAAGSRERYECQYARFGKMEITDQRLSPLASCIHRHHRGYDQEGYISDIHDIGE